MLTTMAVCVSAILRNVPASIGPLSGSLFIGGVVTGCVWADEAGAISNRDAMTMPIAIEVTAIKAAENSVVLRFDIMSSSRATLPRYPDTAKASSGARLEPNILGVGQLKFSST
jgi:hypothetical protein